MFHVVDALFTLGQVEVPPPNAEVLGGALITTLLGYGRYPVVVLSVGAVFYGGGAWAWSHWG